MPTAYPQGLFESVTDAIGEADAKLGGQPYTFLRAQLEATDTTLQVDSTIDLAAAGEIVVNGERIAYTSKTATTLVAPTRADNARQHAPGSIVYDTTDVWSEISSARSQMHFGRAAGKPLDDLLRNFGLPVPAGFLDPQKRAYGRACAHIAAGPLKVIAGALGAVLTGPMLYGTISSATQVTLDGALTWPDISRRCIRILTPAADAGIYRIRSIAGQVATLDPAAGQWWRAGTGLTAAAATWECMPFDLWEHPLEPGKFRVEVLRYDSLIALAGSAFLNGGELRTSTTTLSITTAWPINNVLGVWLAGDVERAGTNYYTGGSFLGSVITLISALPAANTPVIVDYGSIASSAQLLMGEAVSGIAYYPFYLADPGSFVTPVLTVARAAGFLPVQSLVLV